MTQFDKYGEVVTGYDLEARLRSIAMNAVREALIAHGRYDAPVTDNDAAIMENIFKLLHLRTEAEIDRSFEHHAISDHAQQKPSPALAAISSMLDKVNEEAGAEITQLVKAKGVANKA